MQTQVPFRTALRVWAKIGCLSFGGPAGQIALMHEELVERRRWIGEARFLHALNYCMLLPGPEAQQLATYIGWLLHGTKGGLVAGTLFVLPGALLVFGLSWLYASFSGLAWVAALFFGLKAAVIAIVAEALLRVAKRALKSRAQVALACAAFLALFVFAVPFPWVVLTAGTLGLVAGRHAPHAFPVSGAHAPKSAARPAPAARGAHASSKPADVRTDGPSVQADSSLADEPVVDAAFAAGELEHARPNAARALRVLVTWLLAWAAPFVLILVVTGRESVFFDVASFFSRAAVVTFGGAYAVLAYVAQAAVQSFGWLSTEQMIDGLGLAETTPGPLILVTQFVGFMAGWNHSGEFSPFVAGACGAALTTWVTFVPCFLWIFLGAPFVEALRGNRVLASALAAITSAVVGVIANLSAVFALHVVFAEVGRFEWGPVAIARPEFASLDAAALALSLVCCVASLRFRTPLAVTLALGAVGGAVSYLLRG
ncbi:MAG: chromate transporter [Planctomycetes bacterium]|nr:chromate transporter [Planctomycetota bacterium]